MDIEERVRALGGVARPGELGRARAVQRRIAELVAEGRLVRTGGRCVALPGTDPDLLRARALGAPLTCVSAARAHGLALLDEPATTHLAIPHSHGPVRSAVPSGARVTIHREVPSLLTAGPHPRVPGGPTLVVAPAEALARLARCQDHLAAIVALDSALHRRTCTREEIASLLTGPGSPAARAVLAECDGASLSPAESVARVTLRRAGLHVVPNALVEGVGFVDLLVEGRVVVECDGYVHHAGVVAFATDRRRDRALQLQGFVVLRFPAHEVLRDPEALLSCVRAALARS